VLGAEFHVRAVLALQQLAAIVGVQPPTAAGVEQVIGPGHAQQEMPREVNADQGNLQTRASSRAISPRPVVARDGLQHLVSKATCGRNGLKSSWAKPRSFIRRNKGCASSLTGSIGKPELARCCAQLEFLQQRLGIDLRCHVRPQSIALPRTARAVNVADRQKTIGAVSSESPDNASF
jgi:hypothetical protein